MLGTKAGSIAGKVRDNHIVKDDVTSRDLLGFVRGRCCGCSECGKYIIFTKEKYYRKGGKTHPDCDIGIMNCSRCGCSPDCHEIDEVENERERGNDAVALENYDLAIIHYSRALELNNVDWRIWSNRSKCYSAKRWFSQAFSDAERACLLDNENYKVWYRKSIALKGLSKYKEALSSIENSLNCLEKDDNPKPGDVEAIKNFQKDLKLLVERAAGYDHSKRENREFASIKNRHVQQTKSRILSTDPSFQALTESVMRLENSMHTILERQQHFYQDIASRLENIERLIGEKQSEEFGNFSKEFSLKHEYDTGGAAVQSSSGAFDKEPIESGDASQDMSDDSSISRTSSSDASLDEAIQMIENAWKARIDLSSEDSNGGDSNSDDEIEKQNTSLRNDSSEADPMSSQVSCKTSRKSTREYQERMSRIAKTEERISQANDCGEPLACTDIDTLTQQKRTSCVNCENECPGFKIYYSSTDVHDPEIMFYCSMCGCNSEDHVIDLEWHAQEAIRKQIEENQARMRSERMKSRQSKFSEAAVKKQEAFVFLGLQTGSSRAQIKAAYKALAKKYHPDKQADKSNKDDIAYMQELFTKATDAYKLLIEE